MIIPVKCFTCGNVLADKYQYFQRRTKQLKLENGKEQDIYLTKENMEKTVESKVLDELRLYNMCCKRHMLTHVDII